MFLLNFHRFIFFPIFSFFELSFINLKPLYSQFILREIIVTSLLRTLTEESTNNFKMDINPFPNKPWFSCVCSASLLKTLWEKEKLLMTSNFSFTHCVFYPFENFFPFSSNLKSSSATYFSLEESKTCRLGKG